MLWALLQSMKEFSFLLYLKQVTDVRVNFPITVFSQEAVRDFLITGLKSSARLLILPLLRKKMMLL